MSRSSEYANSVSSLYAQIGEARGREAANKGAIWSGALANIGDFVSQYPERKAKMEEIKNRAAMTDLEKQRLQHQIDQEQRDADEDQKIRDLFTQTQNEWQAGQGIVSQSDGVRIGDAIAREKAAGTYQGPNQQSPNYGVRADGTPKGNGFLGPLQRPDGKVSSEISVGVNIDGKEVEIPTLVPTLTPEERNWLLTSDVSDPKQIPDAIIQKAVDYARPRIQAGKSPFAGPDESPTVQPSQRRTSPIPTPSEILRTVSPKKAIALINGLAALKQDPQGDPEKTIKLLQQVANGLNALPEDLRASAYPGIVQHAESAWGVKPGVLRPDYDPTYWKFIMGTGQEPPKPKDQPLVPIPGPDGKPVYGTPVPGQPVYEKSGGATAGSDFNQYLARVAKEKGKTVEQLTAAEELAARKAYGQADDRVIQISPTMQAEQGNAKETAAGIKDGTISPEVLLSTRATAQGMALNAELHKMGVDTNKMTREWTATKGAIRSLNSAQQLRLAEVINKASESLDKVEELNKQWTDVGARSGIKVFNRISLKAAQNGAYGKEAASIAQRLDAQIADVTSELAQGIMGGNSPTDHAFELAKKNLSSDWTQAVLTDAVKQARYNLNLAQNARNDILAGLGVFSTQVQVPPPGAWLPPPAAPVAPRQNPFRR